MELSKKVTLLLSASRKKAEVMGSQLYSGMGHVFLFFVLLYCSYKVLICVVKLPSVNGKMAITC